MKLQTRRKPVPSVIVLTILGMAAVLGGFLLSRISTAPDDSSAAAGDTFTVCAENSGDCDFLFGEGIQQAITVAKTGDVVLIKSGTYTLPQPQIMTASDEQTYNCFAYIQNKNITIRGEGSVILDGSTSQEGLNGICVDSATSIIANLELRNFSIHGSRTFISEGNGIQVLSGSFKGQALRINNNDGTGIALDSSSASSISNSIINDWQSG